MSRHGALRRDRQHDRTGRAHPDDGRGGAELDVLGQRGQKGMGPFQPRQCREMARYGVTVNTIAPVARTRMTVEGVPNSMFSGSEGKKEWDPFSPANVARWRATA